MEEHSHCVVLLSGMLSLATGNATESAGAITVQAGTSASLTGADVVVMAGDSTAGTGTGGSLLFSAGGGGSGGDVSITAGAGTTSGGSVLLTSSGKFIC